MLFFSIIYSILYINIPKDSFYSDKSNYLIGKIINIHEEENKTTYTIKAHEKVIAYYNDKNKYNLGDKVLIKGIFQKPETNKTNYLFNYQDYLKRKNIYYIVLIDKIELKNNNKNIYYFIKQKIINYIDNSPYLNTFILGNKSFIKKDVIRSYQEN